MSCPNNQTQQCGAVAVATTAHGVLLELGTDRNLTVTLTMPERTATVHSRHRIMRYSAEDSYQVSGARLCQMEPSAAYATLDGSTDSTYTASLTDDLTVRDSQIVFMDLRHNILVEHRVNRQLSVHEVSTQSVGGRGQFSGPAVKHLLGPLSVHITGSDDIVLNGETIKTTPYSFYTSSYHLAPEQTDHWYPTPDTTPPILDEWEYPRVRRFFWPPWCEAATAFTRYDDNNANVLTNPLPDVQSGSYSPEPVFYAEKANGSWAVARDGSTFYTLYDGYNITTVKSADGNEYNISDAMYKPAKDILCYPVGIF